MKISMIYFSATGHTQKAAEFIKEGLESAGNIEVKLMNIAEDNAVDTAFVEQSSAVLLGAPTYAANMCWQMKKWLDTDRACKLSGKLGAVFATERHMHGGGDLTMLTMISQMLVKGMLIYSSGAACGAPIIHLGPVTPDEFLDEKKDLFVLYGKRVADKALELFAK